MLRRLRSGKPGREETLSTAAFNLTIIGRAGPRVAFSSDRHFNRAGAVRVP